MEENNLNSNSVNTNNQAPANNIKILVFLMALIIVGLVGYIIYTKVIEKNDNEIPKSNDTQEKENNNTKENNETTNTSEETKEKTNNKNKDVVGSTYKTKNGKKTLKVLSKTTDGYSVEYNGKKLNIYGYDDYGKYSVFMGDKSGESSQCGIYHLIVNDETQELLDLDYEKSYVYDILNVGDKYYFLKGTCGFPYLNTMYNESLNKIADEYITKDKNNNFYAMKDGYITKFDNNGKALKHSSIKPDNKYELLLDFSSIIDGNMYALIETNTKIGIYDFNKDKLIELNNPYESGVCPDGNCSGVAAMNVLGKNILVILHPSVEQERPYQNDVSYLLDTTNGKLESIGNFLTFDEDKEYGEGNFYLYDDASLYKYDNTGKLVKSVDFDYKKVVNTAVTSGFEAYKGNFFVTIKENDDYYIQDAFNKDKYKIDMVDGYEFYNMDILDEKKGDKYVATNIMEITLLKGDSEYIKYKFNMDTKKLSK